VGPLELPRVASGTEVEAVEPILTEEMLQDVVLDDLADPVAVVVRVVGAVPRQQSRAVDIAGAVPQQLPAFGLIGEGERLPGSVIDLPVQLHPAFVVKEGVPLGAVVHLLQMLLFPTMQLSHPPQDVVSVAVDDDELRGYLAVELATLLAGAFQRVRLGILV